MPRKVLILGPSPKKSFLVLDWTRNFNWLSIQIDKKEIAKITSKDEMKEGKVFELPPFGMLSIKLIKQRLGLASAYEVRLNNVPVRKSATDPIQILDRNFLLIAIVGGVNLAAGLTSFFSPVGYLQSFGFGWESAIVGGVYIVLGLLMRYANSLIATYLLLTFYIIDFLLIIFMLFYSGYTSIWGLLFRAYIFTFLTDSITAINELNRQKKKTQYPDVLDM